MLQADVREVFGQGRCGCNSKAGVSIVSYNELVREGCRFVGFESCLV
jgi:hypothetical protein